MAVVAVVALGLVVVGREAQSLSARAHPAVFELEEAVAFIAERLPLAAASRLSHDDVRWILQADADLLEDATEEDPRLGLEVVDPHVAVGRILARSDAEGRELDDTDVVAVLDGRADYLGAIGAIGPEARGPEDPTTG